MKMYLFKRKPRKHFDIFVFDSDHKLIAEKRTFSTEEGAHHTAMYFQQQQKGAYFHVKPVNKGPL